MFLSTALPLAWLLVYSVSANYSEPKCERDLERRGFERLPDREYLDKFALISSNYPSRMSFRAEGSGREIEATIRRYDSRGSLSRTCSFRMFEDENAWAYLKLRSTREGLEIFEVARYFYGDYSKNALDLFLINMTDCKYSKNTLLLGGYDYYKLLGTFTVLYPREDRYFDLFSLNGTDECGCYACRRRFYYENRTISEPMKFELPNEKQEWRLSFIASSGDDGYYALIRRQMYIRLLALSASGSMYSYKEEKIDTKLRFLRISTANDAFGFCYISEEKPREASCMQLDRKLNIGFNITRDMGYDISYLATYNLPEGGLLAMAARCAQDEIKERCYDYELRLAKFAKDGTYGELQSLREENCSPRRRREFRFYEERDGKLCLYYGCDCPEKSAICDDMLRIKCLDY